MSIQKILQAAGTVTQDAAKGFAAGGPVGAVAGGTIGAAKAINQYKHPNSASSPQQAKSQDYSRMKRLHPTLVPPSTTTIDDSNAGQIPGAEE